MMFERTSSREAETARTRLCLFTFAMPMPGSCSRAMLTVATKFGYSPHSVTIGYAIHLRGRRRTLLRALERERD